MAEAPPPLPVGAVLAVTTATQALSTLGILALAAVAPKAAAELGVSSALIGYQVGLMFFGAMVAAPVGGGLARRFGAVRTSQLALCTVGAGCLLSAIGALPLLVVGAIVMGLGYGLTNPSASQLLSRVPTRRSMNLIFSIKQTGVPIGGVLSGVVVPPLTLAFGWQAALVACAAALVALAAAIGPVRRDWDTDLDMGAAVLGTARASLVLVWRHAPLRWLSGASFIYSGVQLCLTGFLVTYLVAEVQVSLVLAGTVLAITHASGAIGRLAWGWLADRLGSGGIALILNGVGTIAGAFLTAAMAPAWPLAAIAATCALFGFCTMGWNGVFVAIIARQAPRGSVGLATGGSLAVTYAGVIATPPFFAALHDQAGLSYGAIYGWTTLVMAAGIALVVQARRSSRR